MPALNLSSLTAGTSPAADTGNRLIRKLVTNSSGSYVVTVAGVPGLSPPIQTGYTVSAPLSAWFDTPMNMVFLPGSEGHLLVADMGANKVRRIKLAACQLK